MSEAPERIWVDGQDYWAKPTYKDDKTEYVRADMLHEIFLRYSKAETARIEELEAKLAEVVAAGVRVRNYYEHHDSKDVYAVSDFNAALAELKGAKHE